VSARYDKSRTEDAENIRLFQAASMVGFINPPSGGSASPVLSHRGSLEQEDESDLSLAAYAKAWDTPCDSAAQKCVLLAIADRADDKGFCWPSVRDISRRTGLAKSCVLKHISVLEANGAISVSRDRRKSNEYRILGIGPQKGPGSSERTPVVSEDRPQKGPKVVVSEDLGGPQKGPQSSGTVIEPSREAPPRRDVGPDPPDPNWRQTIKQQFH